MNFGVSLNAGAPLSGTRPPIERPWDERERAELLRPARVRPPQGRSRIGQASRSGGAWIEAYGRSWRVVNHFLRPSVYPGAVTRPPLAVALLLCLACSSTTGPAVDPRPPKARDVQQASVDPCTLPDPAPLRCSTPPVGKAIAKGATNAVLLVLGGPATLVNNAIGAAICFVAPPTDLEKQRHADAIATRHARCSATPRASAPGASAPTSAGTP